MSTREAFFAVCQGARPAQASYVSLYAKIPFYGGPEEGGWWGADYELVAYYRCSSAEEADVVATKVSELADELDKEAADSFHRGCAEQCEWLEARGLDADFLPEVAGATRYLVFLEDRPGEHAREGNRRWE